MKMIFLSIFSVLLGLVAKKEVTSSTQQFKLALSDIRTPIIPQTGLGRELKIQMRRFRN